MSQLYLSTNQNGVKNWWDDVKNSSKARVRQVGLLGSKPVSNSRLGQDVAGTRRIRLQLTPQIADIDAQQVHGVFVAGASPNFADDLAVREHTGRRDG